MLAVVEKNTSRKHTRRLGSPSWNWQEHTATVPCHRFFFYVRLKNGLRVYYCGLICQRETTCVQMRRKKKSATASAQNPKCKRKTSAAVRKKMSARLEWRKCVEILFARAVFYRSFEMAFGSKNESKRTINMVVWRDTYHRFI